MTRPAAALASIVALTVAVAAQRGAGVAIRLIDVADSAGITLLNLHGGPDKDYIVDANGNGAAFFDFDNDGDLDALLVNGSTRERLAEGGDPIAAMYRNDDGRFRDVTAASGLTARGWGMGACVADVDNDGFQDVYITAFGPNALFRNRGDGTFADVTTAAGVGDGRWSTGCAFGGDLDNDGDIDILVVNLNDRPTLLRNETAAANHWVTLRLVGGSTPLTAAAGRVGAVAASSNRDGSAHAW